MTNIYLKAEKKGKIFSGITWLIETKNSLFHNYYDLSLVNYSWNKMSVLLKLAKDIRNHEPFKYIVLDDSRETPDILLAETDTFDKSVGAFLTSFFNKYEQKIIQDENKISNIYQQVLIYREIVKTELSSGKKIPFIL
ncbi:MAG: hypothetical protein MUC49_22310 [Raineya sp.]|jgi:hypothetical protein|nr:hypothetical protein [Raineya sp.]